MPEALKISALEELLLKIPYIKSGVVILEGLKFADWLVDTNECFSKGNDNSESNLDNLVRDYMGQHSGAPYAPPEISIPTIPEEFKQHVPKYPYIYDEIQKRYNSGAPYAKPEFPILENLKPYITQESYYAQSPTTPPEKKGSSHGGYSNPSIQPISTSNSISFDYAEMIRESIRSRTESQTAGLNHLMMEQVTASNLLFNDFATNLAHVFVDPIREVESQFIGLSDSITNSLSDVTASIELVHKRQEVDFAIKDSLQTLRESFMINSEETSTKQQPYIEQVHKRQKVDFAIGDNFQSMRESFMLHTEERVGNRHAYFEAVAASTHLPASAFGIPSNSSQTNSTSSPTTASSYVQSIALNTQRMADSYELSSESLKLFREILSIAIAKEASKLDVTINMVNNIYEVSDIDAVIKKLYTSIETTMNSSAEGVHL